MKSLEKKIDLYVKAAKDKINSSQNKIYADAINIVRNYIHKQSRVLYGGIAINAVLSKHDDAIYSPNEFPDFDFYSPNHILDAITITNQLFELGYKFVRYVPAVHPNTLRVQINYNVFIADISYLPQEKYKNLPTIKVNDLLYVHPEYMKITLYKTLGFLDVYRWKKDMQRLTKLNRWYPTPQSTLNNPTLASPELAPRNKILTELKKDCESFGLIESGIGAYNFFTQQSIPQSTLEYINVDDQTPKYVEKIINTLSKTISTDSQIVYEIFNGYSSEDLPPHHVIKIINTNDTLRDNIDTTIPIIIIGDYYGMCVSVVGSDKTHVINYNYWLSRMYEHKIAFYGESSTYDIYAIIRSIYITSDNIDWLINTLIKDHTSYLAENNLVGYESTTRSGEINRYQAFISSCSGIDLRLNSNEYKAYSHKNNSIIIPQSLGVYSPFVEIMRIGENVEIKKNKIDELSINDKTKKVVIHENHKSTPDNTDNRGGGSNIQKLGSIIKEKISKKRIFYLPPNFYGDLIERRIYSLIKLGKKKTKKSEKNDK